MTPIQKFWALPELYALNPQSGSDWLSDQFRPIEFLQSPEKHEEIAGPIIDNNEDIWIPALAEKFYSGIKITLRDFLLSEWFPRSPGLFYTEHAKYSRENAMHYVVKEDFDLNIWEVDEATLAEYSEKKIYSNPDDRDYTMIFDPYGKEKMLHGGIGCIRLDQHETADGACLWFMSASSTVTAHEGFPVAIPNDLYNKYIDRIRNDGALRCSLTGILQRIPKNYKMLYYDYEDVPTLYLLVEKIRVEKKSRFNEDIVPRVSVPVSFISSYEGYPNLYASYVTFFPGKTDSLKQRRNWLKAKYVEGRYEGEIITDFDEQVSRTGAPFCLKLIMRNKISTEILKNLNVPLDTDFLPRNIETSNNIYLNIIKDNPNLKEIVMRDKYDISGPVGAVGPNSRAHDINFNQIWNNASSSIELEKLSEELSKLSLALKEKANEPEHFRAIAEVAEAEAASKSGNGAKALEHLKSAGKWTLSVAEKIGITVATAALKTALGL